MENVDIYYLLSVQTKICRSIGYWGNNFIQILTIMVTLESSIFQIFQGILFMLQLLLKV